MASIDSDDEPVMAHPRSRAEAAAAAHPMRCPYLDTITRPLLDFDMQKICSVSLSSSHVYACLVCGKFFEGRGRHTHAYTHSLQAGHHVFINLIDGKVWCLPEGYEVVDAALADIQFALHPSFSPAAIADMDKSTTLSTDVLGVTYLPGFVGLNNLKHTDGFNVVIQALAHVQPLRNFFLNPDNYKHVASALVHKFGELVRKLWSPAAFKSTVSPIEFITEVSTTTKKRFSVGKPVEAADFLTWLLNALHNDLTADDAGTLAAARAERATADATASVSGHKRPRAPTGAATHPGPSGGKRSIITDVFQGEVEVTVVSSERESEEARAGAGKEGATSSTGASGGGGGGSTVGHVSVIPFLVLALDLPPAPLFTDDAGANVIPQVALYTLLNKYDGMTVTDTLKGQYRERKRYCITRLPPYITMTMRRFAKNAFFTEKNPTIVNFPVKNLEMKPYLADPDSLASRSAEDVSHASVAELKALLLRLGCGAVASSALEKSELVSAAQSALAASCGTKYNLIANVVHDNPPSTEKGSSSADPLAIGSYRVHVQHEGSGQWYEVQDLHVQETLPQMIGVSESYIAIYRRQQVATRPSS